MDNGYIRVTFCAAWDDETKQYAVECPELGVATCAGDLDGAFESICEAALLYLDSLEEAGERDRVFEERGLTMYPHEPPASAFSLHPAPEQVVKVANLPIHAYA